jgi:hypothetical protein
MRCPKCSHEFEPQAAFPGLETVVAAVTPYTPDFNIVWEAWPKGKGGHKYAAWKAWCKLRPPSGNVHAAISRAKATKKWRDGFVEHMSTWLNARGWEDDYGSGTGRGYTKEDFR